jgi:hypothetical protein
MPKITKKTVSGKYRQGSGWIVSAWSPKHGCYYLSTELSYWAACRLVRNDKARWDTRRQCYKEPEE